MKKDKEREESDWKVDGCNINVQGIERKNSRDFKMVFAKLNEKMFNQY